MLIIFYFFKSNLCKTLKLSCGDSQWAMFTLVMQNNTLMSIRFLGSNGDFIFIAIFTPTLLYFILRLTYQQNQ
jgi:hypothetical protein